METIGFPGDAFKSSLMVCQVFGIKILCLLLNGQVRGERKRERMEEGRMERGEKEGRREGGTIGEREGRKRKGTKWRSEKRREGREK